LRDSGSWLKHCRLAIVRSYERKKHLENRQFRLGLSLNAGESVKDIGAEATLLHRGSRLIRNAARSVFDIRVIRGAMSSATPVLRACTESALDVN
jgi:hypothetical protein